VSDWLAGEGGFELSDGELEPMSTGSLTFTQPAQRNPSSGKTRRCSKSREMSNMIALVSLDFGGAGSMCDIGKGVDADGCAFG
jgi:hypothetical protein